MKIIFAALLFFAGALYGAPGEATIAGTYQTEGGFESTTLELLTNGTYTARMDLDIYPGVGRALGKWRLDGDQVILTPKKEEGRLKDRLRVMVIRTTKGRKILMRTEDVKEDPNNPWAPLYLNDRAKKTARLTLSEGKL